MIYDVAGELTQRIGRGAEIVELRDAFEEATGAAAPSSFTSEVSSLARRGVLEKVGGRAGHTLYAPAGSGLRGIQNEDDDALLVLRALRSAYRRLRRAVSTREVAEELRRLGLELSSDSLNAVKKYLETLSRRRTRGAKGMKAPQVRRVAFKSFTGAPSAHWVPADVQGQVRVAPRSTADALRYAIFMAEADLLRPASRSELRWWLGTPLGRASSAGVLKSPKRISGPLGRLARHDAEFDWEVGRVHAVETPFTCHGGGPTRYSTAPPTPIDLSLCAIEDGLRQLRPADELKDCGVLARRARMAKSDAMGTLAAVRRDLLGGLFVGLMEGVPDRGHLVHRVRLAGQAMQQWVEDAGLNPDRAEGRLRRLRERAFQVGALETLIGDHAGLAVDHLRVGQAATCSYEQVAPLVEAAGAFLDVPEGAEKALLERVRRFPVQEAPGKERFGKAHALDLARLDRVDTLAELWQLFPVPRTRALLTSAQLLLGHVLRDGDLVASVLRLTPPPKAADRRAMTVALGMLGVVPERGDPLDAHNPDDTAAWCLAVIFATLGQAEGVLAEALTSSRGAARRTIDTALMRLSAGYTFSAIG